MSLCAVCREIFLYLDLNKSKAHHPDLHTLELSAAALCLICKVLWTVVSNDARKASNKVPKPSGVQDDDNAMPISKYTIRRVKDQDAFELSFTVNVEGANTIGYAFSFYLRPARQFLLPVWQYYSPDLNAGTESPEITISYDWNISFKRARQWLSTCEKRHKKCRAYMSNTANKYTPRRLLQIERSSPQSVRLMVDPSKNSHRYATVSHCWGVKKTLTLGSSTCELLQQGIPTSTLGRKLQDSIYAISQLGIEFVWIDSLCILQDSLEDWQGQAPLMHQVYMNSTINIAASIAADGHMSCLRERNVSEIEPCIVRTGWESETSTTFELIDDAFQSRRLESLPLFKRAWVVQELLLAPRILHLSGQQLFWECYERTSCETYPNGIPFQSYATLMPKDRLWQILNKESQEASSMPSDKDLRRLWVAILEQYTKCELTFGSDKLVALSATARIMSKTLNDNYCAGLWSKDLIMDLSWYGSDAESSTRPQPYRAPTWSWASKDGRITGSTYSSKEQNIVKEMARVVDYDLEYATGDPFGPILGGYLVLSGPLVSMKLSELSDGEKSLYFNGKWWHQSDVPLLRLDCQPQTSQLYCMPLFVNTHQLPHWLMRCLLLEPVESMLGHFKRAGVLIFFSGTFELDDWETFRKARNEDYFTHAIPLDTGEYQVTIL